MGMAIACLDKPHPVMRNPAAVDYRLRTPPDNVDDDAGAAVAGRADGAQPETVDGPTP